jgi:vacuolar-type H+-ATPase subunit B/Vma2
LNIQSDQSVHIQSGSNEKHSTLTVGKCRQSDLTKKDYDAIVDLDKNGIHANCEQFQINDRTGTKLVAIDATQIKVYTDDVSIITG